MNKIIEFYVDITIKVSNFLYQKFKKQDQTSNRCDNI